MEKVFKFELMEACMKDFGEMIEPMVLEDLFMKMVMYMKENELMIKLMDKELIFIPMDRNMLDNGKMTNNMAKELKLDLIELFIVEITFKGKNMVLANLFDPMVQNMKVNLEIII